MGYVYDQELSKLLAARGIGCAWPDSVGEWKIIDIFYETLIGICTGIMTLLRALNVTVFIPFTYPISKPGFTGERGESIRA